MKKLLNSIPNQFILLIFVVAGIIVGLVAYAFYMSRAQSYLSDNPASCVNCHIMSSYYQSWSHSSHGIASVTCNDCHVPHENVFKKYAFKAKDGLYHAAVFTMRSEPQTIRPRTESYEVIMNNCIRCHEHLNTAYVGTGLIDYHDVLQGKGKACWDCHTNVPHTKISNLSSSPAAVVPLPSSPVPKWLEQLMNKNK